MRYLLLLLNSLAWAAGPRVEVRANEVWIVTDELARQLTNDGKSKYQAALSPSANRIAYYEACPQSEHCLPSVVVLNLEGRRLQAFHPIAEAMPPGHPCASVLGIFWLREATIAADCHINPSLGEYVETDLRAGTTIKDLLGYWFTPSPDRKYIAHVGLVVHFAPPFAKSNYLQIDKTTVYPLPKGAKPAEEQRDVVGQMGSTWIGIHEFMPGFFWSPDSKRVAFIDCVFDWAETGEAENGATLGNVTNRRCFAAVVARTGQVVSFPISGAPVNANAVSFSWDGPNRLSARIGGRITKFRIP